MKMCFHRVRDEGNILHEMIRRKANWIDHILRRNCLLNHIVERRMDGWLEVTGGRE
jgi:hypothetical protein